ncbi:VOC family protein [Paenibacillus sp. JCM 10914]|uniref:VOC family protein n=1 Tax=Paenibacillus sp. JCM 10914 TaxID=1236974 RepID=UPI0003CC32AB|nr:VOC family protein [Paenibacillus sp. JCM 10914]GAE04491.1 hypothetical protein JCM10914_541 [Paenibacillus sp. JCM 10914]
MFHHVEINVSNLEQSRLFWEWFLEEMGCEIFQEWEGGISWKKGGGYLVFVQTDSLYLDIPYHRRRSGLNHLAFHAESRAQVDLITRQLIERDIPILYADRHPYAGGDAHYAVFFEDPDRIKIELVAPIE